MRILLLAFLSIISTTITISAQGDYDFPDGLYGSFEDLKRNRAMSAMPFESRLIYNKSGISRYSITKEASYRKIRGVYCYVIDNHIYLNCGEYGKKGYFVRSHFSGRYIYFDDIIGRENFAFAHTGVTAAAVPSKVWGVVLDMRTGKTIKLSNRKVKKLLKDYPKLLRKYENSDKKNSEVKALIKELNDQF